MRQLPKTPDRSLFRAMAHCLELEALWEEWWRFVETGWARNVILREIQGHQAVRESPNFAIFVNRLIEVIQGTDRTKSPACLFALSELSTFFSEDFRETLLRMLLPSRRKADRMCAYRMLHRNPREGDSAIIMDVWRSAPSKELGQMVVRKADPEYQSKHFAELSDRLRGTWGFRRLHVNMAQLQPVRLDELRETDPTSYAYVLTKMGKPLSADEARQIYDSCTNENERGLLIWCFGHQGLWNLLAEIAAKSEEARRHGTFGPDLVEEDHFLTEP